MQSIARALSLAFCLLSIGPAAKATDFLTDDFEGYLDDLELAAAGWQAIEVNTPNEPAAWTILNPGGRGNPPTEDGNPSTGNFLISDSDKVGGEDVTGSGMSHDLWSPSFSTSGSGTVWLHFDCTAQLNNNGVVIFDVDVSTDAGDNWTNVYRRIAPSRVAFPPAVDRTNSDGFYGRLHIDLSALAANKPDVMVRWRQFEPNDDWWIAIDNVLVDNHPVVGGQYTLLALESFTTGIPPSWKVRSDADPVNTGDDTWNTNDLCKRSIIRGGGTFPYLGGRAVHRLDEFFAIVDNTCDPVTVQDEYLITPVTDFTKATAVFLHYKEEAVVDSASVLEVVLSLDGGNSFETPPIFAYNLGGGYISGEESFYSDRILEVPLAAGKKNIAFAFHYTAPGAQHYWAVDDVKATADGPGLNPRTCANRQFQVGNFDSTAGSVTSTWKPIAGDEGFRVLRNGTAISGDLGAAVNSYTDSSPPAGSSVNYSLVSLKGGAAEMECPGSPVVAYSCPRDLFGCANSSALTVTLNWKSGLNLAGTGYAITRNGTHVKTVPFTAGTYVDTVPGPGAYEYSLSIEGGGAEQCPGLPLGFRTTLAGADVIYFEDFDCLRTDDDVVAAGWEIVEENQPGENALWTVTNPGTRANPPIADGRPSQGLFLVSDSDAANGNDGQGSGRSHDALSPPFNCTGKTAVWLHMDCSAVLNNNGEVIFDVDVTNDDGGNWTNVFRRIAPGRSSDPAPLADIPADMPGGPQTGNSDAFFGRLDLDISAVAAGKPSVRFRLRQFEPSDDWWIAVDDIQVDSTPVVEGTKVILAESFEGGIPGEWGLESKDLVAPWKDDDGCMVSLLHFNGGTFPDGADGRRIHYLDNAFALVAFDDFCGTSAQDETLFTPSLDLTSATRAFLHFKSDILMTDAKAEVLLSLDGGNTYDTAHPIWSNQLGGGMLRDAGNAEVVYNEYIFEVPEAAGKPTVVIGFHYVNSVPQSSFWAIDEVRVTAEVKAAGAGFIRGDCNSDGQADITDAVFNLNYQFLGGATPACMEACNTTSDGGIDITDPVFLLNYLFLGGPAPAAPGPLSCGKDPEPGPLSCDTPRC